MSELDKILEQNKTRINKNKQEPKGIMTTVVQEDGSVIAIPYKDLTKEQKLARLIEIRDRGFLNDRLHVPLPAHIHGEWCPNDPAEIERLIHMGFEIDTDYAPSRSIHHDGTGKPINGDVVHMITPKENYELICTVRQMAYDDRHGKANSALDDISLQKEERDFGSQLKTKLPTINESKSSTINANQLREALEQKS